MSTAFNSAPSESPEALQRADALLQQSRRLKSVGMLDDAERCLREALTLSPQFAAAWNNLGTLLQGRGRVDEALGCYDAVLKARPDVAETWANRATIHQQKGLFNEAIAGFSRAVELKPDYWPAQLYLGKLLWEHTGSKDALVYLNRALELNPSCTEALIAISCIRGYYDDPLGAVEALRKALAIDPNSIFAKLSLSLAQLNVCDWSDYESREADINQYAKDVSESKADFFLNPLALNFFRVPPGLHTAAAEAHARQIRRLNTAPARPRPKLPGMSSLIRVGYISPDFRNHAVGRLMYEVFAHHDKGRFEVYSYHTLPEEDEITARIRSGSNRFRNLSGLSVAESHARISGDQLDLLIDLAGYTIFNSSAVLANRPAPVQVQFMGYPDTMGADFIQYAITDDWLTPADVQASYTEKIVRIPHAFVGSSLGISDFPVSRSMYGLPERGMVYTCFNTPRKFEPRVFAAWMRILKGVPDSVLWLLKGQTVEVEDRLRDQAMAHGVDPSRLVFREQAGYADYLACYKVAELFLDTFVYNAGSTAIAALWGGCPVLTLAGPTNASRMGASICAAARLEELICRSEDEYVEKAISIGLDLERLRRLKAGLTQHRDQLPLFDAYRFTRDLEQAFIQMLEGRV